MKLNAPPRLFSVCSGQALERSRLQQRAADYRITDYRTADLLEKDNEFVAACQDGDLAAWESLVKRHSRRIYGLCYRFTGRHCEAQDLTQEVFLRLFRMIGNFRSAELSFGSWLTILTRNLLIDHYRRRRHERRMVSIEDHPPRFEGFGRIAGQPEAMAAGRETSAIVRSALLKLPPNLREIIVLYDLRGMQYREIALAMGIPIGTVKSRLNRGRAVLARLLWKYKSAA